MTKSELINLVKRLQEGDYKDDNEGSELMKLLKKNVSHPRVSNLIFWDKRELTAEEIVEEALEYKPIQLSSSSE